MFKSQNRTNHSKVYAFNINQERWEGINCLPDLNTARANHSACAMENTVYVFGGSISDAKDLNTIEFMKIHQNLGTLQRDSPSWTIFEIDELCPRRCALLCQLPNSELLIYGGHDGEACVSDGVIFDTETNKVADRINPNPNNRV